MSRIFVSWAVAIAIASPAFAAESVEPEAAAVSARLAKIKTIVVIYAENRSFDNLYGFFPGADGLKSSRAKAARLAQKDRNGQVLKELPPVWSGLTAPGVVPPVTQIQTEHLPNAPFRIDDPNGFNVSMGKVTRDLWHRFYQNQMQINNSKNDRFAAWADSGGAVMGYYDGGASLPLWNVAKQYTLADNFYMGAFGGSFLNHQYLICSCAPIYPNANNSPAAGLIAAVNADKVSLKVSPTAPASAIDGPPQFVNDGAITPDFYAVNTMQPPYQPSSVPPAAGGDPAFANPAVANVLPPQTQKTIGDLLSTAGVTWAWYGGAWQAALNGQNASPIPNFQFHHQPFNYFAAYAPGTPARAEHLRDGGLDGSAFIAAIDAGTLPEVTFYKPQGNLNEHPGYADVLSGDNHIVNIIQHLQNGPQWANMVVVVTYDENGGFWDHAAPPKADRFGPGSRIPALIVSPFARKGFVDHTRYDTTSILRLITKRYNLPKLPGIAVRDAAIKRQGGQPLGDLVPALKLTGN
ncbi:acid phosphatase [Methylocella silvestris BL2]|uniref:Acid phosphatase n=1 Tax=Methylocella silvestris (strain DSM 15510 / CIP 108128 / LMG 27833 / NCIMB 13906 / BL2) TaxID=395965 RepID=B8EKA4_METSB|nr:acid phosphatase [Methylocella silvestris]ACK50644.1 acid phosphatase [Methylocella silvestris BL2]